ncbi:hypothetical protein PMIN04_013247 [Paraphaeosphaeria minitans]
MVSCTYVADSVTSQLAEIGLDANIKVTGPLHSALYGSACNNCKRPPRGILKKQGTFAKYVSSWPTKANVGCRTCGRTTSLDTNASNSLLYGRCSSLSHCPFNSPTKPSNSKYRDCGYRSPASLTHGFN